MPRSLARFCAALLLVGLLPLTACRREAVAPGDPVAAVKGLAEAIRDNDLPRYSRLSMPPALHKKMEARWKAELAVAPPPSERQKRDYARWMTRLTAPKAEAELFRSLDPKLKRLETEIGSQWPLMQATAGIFLSGVLKANERLTDSEKEHAKTVGAALIAWLQPALLTDRVRARQAIRVVVETARKIDLPTLEQSRALEMIPALEKGSIALKGFKRIGRLYGVDGDAALATVEAKVAEVEGDIATLEVSYSLLGRTVRFDMQLIRRDGRWYSADAVRNAEAKLAKPLASVP
jgi:hypothetical protein